MLYALIIAENGSLSFAKSITAALTTAPASSCNNQSTKVRFNLSRKKQNVLAYCVAT